MKNNSLKKYRYYINNKNNATLRDQFHNNLNKKMVMCQKKR